jgi:nucleoside-diphosphate-sugar epimerase
VSVYPFDEQRGDHSEFREEDADRKINPEGGYGWSKYLAEKQLALMAPAIPSGIARIFHSYGENIYLKPDKSQVIGSLIRKSIRYPKEDFVIWGNGMQRRCFVFIDDTIDALFKFAEYIERTGNNLTANIGSTEETTVKQIATLAIALSGKKIEPRYDLSKPTGALNRMPNLERINQTLGWKPTTDFKTGFQKTFSWAEKRLNEWRDI